MNRFSFTFTVLLGFSLAALPCAVAAQDFRFDSSISKQVLENYLERSISFTELLHDDLKQAKNSHGVDPRDNIRFLTTAGVKLVGRSLMMWGGENRMPTLLANAKPFIDTLHKIDPDMIMQAAVFEYVSKSVETLPIPAHVFTAFGLPVETRNFKYADIVFADGQPRGGITGVPDMNRMEARMWFYFLSAAYIDVGIEGLHWGQIGLMDQNDKGHVAWQQVLGMVREYAHKHARRHMVICDAHTSPGRAATGQGGYVENGKLLFDVHAFPMRIAETVGQPYKATLKINYSDGLYLKSKGGITPSGWSCDHLPYIVEFDNFGSNGAGSTGHDPYVWGWDEITWYNNQSEADREAFLRYAFKWIKETDPICHLEMPGSRTLSAATNGQNWYWANNKSTACPNGSNTEAVIKSLWGPLGAPIAFRSGPGRSRPGVPALTTLGFSADGRLRAWIPGRPFGVTPVFPMPGR